MASSGECWGCRSQPPRYCGTCTKEALAPKQKRLLEIDAANAHLAEMMRARLEQRARLLAQRETRRANEKAIAELSAELAEVRRAADREALVVNQLRHEIRRGEAQLRELPPAPEPIKPITAPLTAPPTAPPKPSAMALPAESSSAELLIAAAVAPARNVVGAVARVADEAQAGEGGVEGGVEDGVEDGVEGGVEDGVEDGVRELAPFDQREMAQQLASLEISQQEASLQGE